MKSKKEDDIQLMEIRRTEIADKIRMAQHKFYRREMSPESFKDIVRDYEKQLIDLDLEISKMKRKTETTAGEDSKPQDEKQA